MYEKSVAINTLSENSRAFPLKSEQYICLELIAIIILQVEPIKKEK